MSMNKDILVAFIFFYWINQSSNWISASGSISIYEWWINILQHFTFFFNDCYQNKIFFAHFSDFYIERWQIDVFFFHFMLLTVECSQVDGSSCHLSDAAEILHRLALREPVYWPGQSKSPHCIQGKFCPHYFFALILFLPSFYFDPFCPSCQWGNSKLVKFKM